MNAPLQGMPTDWAEANRRHLAAAVAAMAARMQHHAGRGTAEEDGLAERLAATERALRDEEEALPAAPARAVIAERFGLSAFEAEVLLLGAAAALRPDLPPESASFGAALAALPGGHWTATTPDAPLRAFRLIELGPGPLLAARLSLPERMLHALAGLAVSEPALAGIVTPASPPHALLPAQQGDAAAVAARLASVPLVLLSGGDGVAQRAVAAAAAARLGHTALLVQASALAEEAGAHVATAQLVQREAILAGAVVLIDGWQAPSAAARFALHMPLPAILLGEDVALPDGRTAALVTLSPSGAAERETALRMALGAVLGDRLDGLESTVSAIAARFPLGAGGIASLAATVSDGDASTEALWAASRALSRPGSVPLATRTTPPARLADVVLPRVQSRQLEDILRHARHAARVHETWGFARQPGRMPALAALFAGPPGTGKTLAAEAIAGELALDLWRVDLSRVVSKWIGETEKNLRALFDQAEAAGAVLFFDEADALFGARTTPRDAQDRYANLEVAYLLQRIELFSGLAILATNMKDAIDPAFLRRFRFVVDFPFPEEAERLAIWRHAFPAEAPVTDIRHDRLARLAVPGGTIRNIALHAAFRAAEHGGAIGMADVLAAARDECVRIGRPLLAHETEGWR